MIDSNFFRFERKNDDFPFYNDDKTAFTVVQSLFLLIVSIASIFIFESVGDIIPRVIRPFVNIIIPLGAFILVTKSNWTKLFRKLQWKDILVVISVLIVNLIVSIVFGALLTKFAGADSNPVAHTLQTSSMKDNVMFLIKVIPMLFGEELITIIPFLVILQFATRKLKLSRKNAVLVAWIVSAIIFGALHLKTYNWNIIQAVLGIGIARIILTFAYIKTKNIWVSAIVHILNDWILFLPAIFM